MKLKDILSINEFRKPKEPMKYDGLCSVCSHRFCAVCKFREILIERYKDIDDCIREHQLSKLC